MQAAQGTLFHVTTKLPLSTVLFITLMKPTQPTTHTHNHDIQLFKYKYVINTTHLNGCSKSNINTTIKVFYSPTDAPANCLKINFNVNLKLFLRQFTCASVGE
jgi:hypothetical protein